MSAMSIDEIYTMDYDLQKLFAMRQVWKPNSVFEMKKPRHNTAFLYIESGEVHYKVSSGAEISASEGSVVYLPEGSEYTSRFITRLENVITLLCEFSPVDKNNRPFNFFDEISVLTPHGAKVRFDEMITACSIPNKSPALLKSVCFGIINEVLLSAKNARLKNSAAFSSIRKGIMYLENDPLQEKSISEIAAMCNVCESGFRRLFKLYSGMAPGEYRLSRKISRAKKLLSSGNMSVEEVAYSLGFTECGYFCKLFKKKTGVSPGKYMGMN